MRIGRFAHRIAAGALGLGLFLGGQLVSGQPAATAAEQAGPVPPAIWCSQVLAMPGGQTARRCIDYANRVAYQGWSYRYRQMTVTSAHPLLGYCRFERTSVPASDGQRGTVSGRLTIRTAYGRSTPGVQYKRVGTVSYGRPGIFVYATGKFVPYGTGSWRRVVSIRLPAEPQHGWGVEPYPWPPCR